MKNNFIMLTAALVAFFSFSNNVLATDSIIPMADLCTSCHKAEQGVSRGFLGNIAVAARVMQIDFISHQEIIKFNNDTVLTNLESFEDIGNYRQKGLKVSFIEVNNEKLATEIIRFNLFASIDPAAKLAKDVLKKVITSPRVKIYDVRPLAEFEMGHIPGAMPMPALHFEKYRHNLPNDKETPIIFYGADDCLSHIGFINAKSLGYTKVAIYAGGYQEWSATEYVMVDSSGLRKAIKENIPHVLIDLRQADNIRTGSIRGAVNIAATDLAKSRSLFPAEKDAPIIFYGPGSRDAAAQVISWGYSAVGIIPASFDGWKAISNQVNKSSARTSITFVPPTTPGTIPANQFANSARFPNGTKLIIDVRTPEELFNGSIQGAVNIPLTQLSRRAKELPIAKDIILFSNKGFRAEMAHKILSQLNRESRYLDADLSFDTTGFKIYK